MKEYFDTNRDLWDRLAEINSKSAFYDLEGFKAGESSLSPVELEEVGGVAGRSLLHLQCHFGMDTLSWARLGAKVTGVDFSEEAIRLARELAGGLNIDARFVRSNVYDLPEALDERFDIVFTSYGVLSWLPDLKTWAKVASHFLKPGGTFYIIEFHPVVYMLDEEKGDSFQFPYFHSPDPLVLETDGSYADRSADLSHTEYSWIHSLSDVINALIEAGLKLEYVHEFPFSAHDCFKFVEETAPRRFKIKGRSVDVPMMFSIRATK